MTRVIDLEPNEEVQLALEKAELIILKSDSYVPLQRGEYKICLKVDKTQ